MGFDSWDEIRTAYQVARAGTVSGAAEVLGVHHATVIRHIDALEARLGARLFQRHPRGYTPTEAGRLLLAVAQATDDQFAQLGARIAGAGEEVSGELIITSLPNLSAMVMPALARLSAEHPAVRLRYITDPRVFRLEYGEAHVAIRAGARPTEPDNVVQHLTERQTALYAAPAYIAAHGAPADDAGLARHRFVGPEAPEGRAPYHRWLAATVARDSVVFASNENDAQRAAIMAGLGLGFLPVLEARGQAGLTEVMGPRPEWSAPLWLVTHVDLHRTPKVQAALRALKEAAAACPIEG
ncbi:MAG: LysR family transcriptional regulator [Alphaproteobacteria bacterium HGW-Alphaproteobacteria-4]|nr:MAG: LysR family transcriptional regulator [Alphaproteobacteria bacterium HGW-Alphaproteobacteria-4]